MEKPSQMKLVLLEKWQTDKTKFVLLGDKASRGAEYAELEVLPQKEQP